MSKYLVEQAESLFTVGASVPAERGESLCYLRAGCSGATLRRSLLWSARMNRSIFTTAVHAGERARPPEFTPVVTPIYNSVGYL